MKMEYEIHLGEEDKSGLHVILGDGSVLCNNSSSIMVINEEQKMIIDAFANTKKDKKANTIYYLNDVVFRIYPKIY